MDPFAVYIHLELLEVVPIHGEQRRLIMQFVRSLATAPHTPGDFTDKDRTLRTRQVRIVGQYAVTYWVDAPARAVMVVDVRRADGR